MSYRKYLALLALLFLSGCVTAPVHYNSSPEEFSNVPDTHGVVVFQNVNMDSRIHPHMYGWTSFRASRLGGPTSWLKEGEEEPLTYAVYPDYSVIPGTSLWVGVLPAGNYLAEDFYSWFNNGEYYGHMSAPVPDRLASFTVEAGKVTLLDTYLYNGLLDTFRMANVSSPDELLERAVERYPEIMSSVDSNALPGFSSSVESEPEKTREDFAKWASVNASAVFAPDGHIYRPLRMGRILERSPDGEWRNLALDTFETVASTFAGMNGELVAVTRGGRAFRRLDADDAFVEMPLDFGDSRLNSLARLPNGDWIASVIITRERREGTGYRNSREGYVVQEYELEVLRVSDFDAPAWQSILRIPVEKSYAAIVLLDSLGVVTNAADETTLVDFATGEVFKSGPAFSHVRKFHNGLMLGVSVHKAGIWASSGPEPYYSTDNGRSWNAMPSVMAKGMPGVLPDGGIVMPGWVRGENSNRRAEREPFEGFLGATLNAKKWKKLEKPPEGCSGWVEFEQTADALLALCEYATFRRTGPDTEWIKEDMRHLGDDDKQET